MSDYQTPPVHKGSEHVARHMAQHPGTRNRVLVLSDGHANRGVTEPDLLADTAVGLRNRGIFTSTVGIGLDYSTAQLEVLAEHGGGMMHRMAPFILPNRHDAHGAAGRAQSC